MHIGHYISGAAHTGFILWVLFGGAFRPEPIPFEVTDVAVISEQEFLALSATASAPEISDTVAALSAPNDPEPEQTPQATAPDPDVAPVVKPQPRPQPPADPLPNAPQRDAPPAPKPIDRVAPEPVAPPPPDVAEAETAQDSVSLTGDTAADTPQDQQEVAAPQEAATEIVTEAAPTPSGAPSTSPRPRKRPAQLAQVSEPDPAPDPAPAQDAEPPVDQQSVNDALASVLADTQADTPSGPPLSFSERETFRASVQRCWNLDDGSLWARVTVTVAMTLDRTGKVNSDPRLVASQGGSESDTQIAFQAARRAIYLCQKSGYSLPADKYDQWREIEITFNPNN